MLSKSDQPKWVFAAQIGIGILAIILSILILITPIISIISLIVLVSVLLLIVGIEKVIAGIFVKNRARFSNLGLGILVIILAIIVMAFPVGTSVFVVILVAVALLFDGISRIVHGIRHKNQSKLDRQVEECLYLYQVMMIIAKTVTDNNYQLKSSSLLFNFEEILVSKNLMIILRNYIKIFVLLFLFTCKI